MKVVIRTEEFRFFLLLPTTLFLTRPMISLFHKLIQSQFPDYRIEEVQLFELAKTLKRCKKVYPHLTIVQYQGANQDVIYVRL